MKAVKKKMTGMGVLAVIAVILFFTSQRIENGNFVNGFAVGLFAVSILKLFQYLRLSRNKEKMKKFEIEQKEERLIMLAEKSGRMTLYLSILVEIFAGIVLMFLGKDTYAMAVCCVAAAQTVVYLLLYYWFAKKF